MTCPSLRVSSVPARAPLACPERLAACVGGTTPDGVPVSRSTRNRSQRRNARSAAAPIRCTPQACAASMPSVTSDTERRRSTTAGTANTAEPHSNALAATPASVRRSALRATGKTGRMTASASCAGLISVTAWATLASARRVTPNTKLARRSSATNQQLVRSAAKRLLLHDGKSIAPASAVVWRAGSNNSASCISDHVSHVARTIERATHAEQRVRLRADSGRASTLEPCVSWLVSACTADNRSPVRRRTRGSATHGVTRQRTRSRDAVTCRSRTRRSSGRST